MTNEAALIAARGNKTAVGMADFEAAVDRVIGGLEKKNKVGRGPAALLAQVKAQGNKHSRLPQSSAPRRLPMCAQPCASLSPCGAAGD